MSNLKLSSLFSVDSQIVIITGGSSGIGFMIASGFIMNNAIVYIVSRKEKECKKVAEALNKYEVGKCNYIVEDLSTEKGVVSFIKKFGEQETKLNVLINNSGISWGAPFDDYPDAAWDKVMGLNLKTVFNLTRACLPFLEKGSSKYSPSRVINIGSITGITPQTAPTYAYDCSKAAVHSLTKKLAAEFTEKKLNITVNAIAPGLVPSKMSKQLLVYASDEDKKKGVEGIGKIVPLGRVGIEEDMAGAAIYLASKAGAWVTGTIMVVDGGVLTQSAKMHMDSNL